MSAEDKKHEKFRELAVKRTNKALEAIRVISNLANRQTYAYTDEETAKIVAALRDAVQEVEARFSRTYNPRNGDFSL